MLHLHFDNWKNLIVMQKVSCTMQKSIGFSPYSFCDPSPKYFTMSSCVASICNCVSPSGGDFDNLEDFVVDCFHFAILFRRRRVYLDYVEFYHTLYSFITITISTKEKDLF